MWKRQSLLFMSVALAVAVSCRNYKIVEVASERKLSIGWTEIYPKSSLAWSEPEEEIAFKIDSPHSFNRDLFPVLDNGKPCPIEVMIVGEDGLSYPLDGRGLLNDEMYFDALVPPNVRSFKSIKIKSECEMEVSNVLWRGYDPRNVKR